MAQECQGFLLTSRQVLFFQKKKKKQTHSCVFTGLEDNSGVDFRKSLVQAQLSYETIIGWSGPCPVWFWKPPKVAITASEWPVSLPDCPHGGKGFPFTHLNLLPQQTPIISHPPDMPLLWRPWLCLLSNILTGTDRLLGKIFAPYIQQSSSSDATPDPSVCLHRVKAPDLNHLGSFHLNLLHFIDVFLVPRGPETGCGVLGAI